MQNVFNFVYKFLIFFYIVLPPQRDHRVLFYPPTAVSQTDNVPTSTVKDTNVVPETRGVPGDDQVPQYGLVVYYLPDPHAQCRVYPCFLRHRSISPENARAITDYAPVVSKKIKNNNKKNV